jgi:cytochrome c oxidase subunit 1
MHSIVPADTQQTDTYFVVAHFHYVLFGGLVFALIGGLYYWFPKVTGHMMNEKLGKWNFWTLVIGFNLTFFPMHFVGLFGQPRRTYRYNAGLGWDIYNLLATIGAFVIAISTLLLIINLVISWKKGKVAGADPWDARSLEWSIPSPPPAYNFAELPEVTHRDDFWHRKYTEDEQGMLVRLPSGGSDNDADTADGHSESHGEGHGNIHLPSPSYYPLVFGLGIPMVGYGAVFHMYWLGALGILFLLFSMYAWGLEPSVDEEGAHE